MVTKKLQLCALCAMLLFLCTRVSAQTEEQVQLKDGTKVSWAEFAQGVNNPSSVVGAIDPALQTTYNDAVANAGTKKTARDDAQTEVNAKQSGVTAAQGAIATKQGDVNTAQGAVAAAQAAFNKAELKKDTAATDLENARFALERVNNQIVVCDPKTVTSVKQWLVDASNAANVFSTNVGVDYDTVGAADNDLLVWYRRITKTAGRGSASYDCFTFSNLDSAGLVNDGYDSVSLQVLTEDFYAEGDHTYLYEITGVYVYIAQEDSVFIALNTVDLYSAEGLVRLFREIATKYSNAKSNDSYKETKNTPAYQALLDSAAAKQSKVDTSKDAYDAAVAALGTAKAAYQAAQEGLETANADLATAQAALATAQAALATAQDTLATAQSEYEAAQTAATEAKTALDAAQASANETAREKYSQAKILVDFTADVKLNSYAGQLQGEDHIITLNGVNALIERLTAGGSVTSLGLNGGEIANAHAPNSIFRSAAKAAVGGTIYNSNGVETAYTNNDGEFGYALRGSDFGLNMDTKKLDNTSKVYKAVTYLADNNTTTFYTNVVDGQLFPARTIAANTFTIFADADEVEVNTPNIVIDGKCANVVLSEGATFYCPQDILAVGTLSYNRVFPAGWSATCLPFEINASEDGKSLKVYGFEEEDADGNFWFIKSESINANKPAILYNETEGCLFGNVPVGTGITIRRTEGTMVSRVEGHQGAMYGTYKRISAPQIAQNHNVEAVYGFAGDGKFHQAGENSYFNPFRAYVISEEARANAPQRAVRFHDENGNEIDETPQGVDVATENEFTLVGGKGELNFVADEAVGTVAVFSVSGMQVANVDVQAGVTTIALPQGVYVVKGQKAIVY